MKGLVIVAGIPYSGKTTFCKELQKSNPEKFHYIEGDKVFDELMQKPELFFEYLKRTDLGFYWTAKTQLAQMGFLKPKEQLSALVGLSDQFGAKEYLKNMQSYVALTYCFEEMAKLHPESCPIMEGLHTTRKSRQNLYERMKLYPAFAKMTEKSDKDTPTTGDLDDMRKFIVYFDLGVGISLRRLRKRKGKRKHKTMVTKPSSVTRHFEMQELPSGDEIPNLEILIVKSQAEVDFAVRTVSAAYN